MLITIFSLECHNLSKLTKKIKKKSNSNSKLKSTFSKIAANNLETKAFVEKCYPLCFR